MAARFTLASGLTTKLEACSAYLASFSKRSLSLLLLLTVTITVCFLYSSHAPNYLSNTPNGFLYARNASHLLSSGTYDCAQCKTPPIEKYTEEQVFEACLDPGVVPEYYLSVVFVTRNDNYGDQEYHRVQNAIDSTFLLAENTTTLIELLIIEWNPPAGRRSVRDMYHFRRSSYLTYRIITVTPRLHDKVSRNDHALYEYEGKNMGIRFARGAFVVCTNQDDIWSPNMHNAIASRSWRKKMFYTQFQDSHIEYDSLPSTLVQIPSFPSDDILLRACEHDAFEAGAFVMPEPVTVNTSNFLQIGREASDFTLAHRDTWKLTAGYREMGAKTWMDMELLLTAAWSLDIPVTYSEHPFTCHQQHRPVAHPNTENENQDVYVDRMQTKEELHMNDGKSWAMQTMDLWRDGLRCEVFRGGLGI